MQGLHLLPGQVQQPLAEQEHAMHTLVNVVFSALHAAMSTGEAEQTRPADSLICRCMQAHLQAGADTLLV